MGLDLIAICDHHSMRNAEAVQQAARESDLVVLAGMEVTSLEEVHTLGIFGDLQSAQGMQEVVDSSLPGENVPEVFGHQVLLDAEDEIVGSEDRFLAGATVLSLHQVVETIHRHGGIAIACHVDREAYSLLAQLGWIPDGLPLDGLELTSALDLNEAIERFPQIKGWPVIRGSDAHQPEELGKAWTRLRMAESSFEELKLALQGAEGRGVIQGET